MEVLSKATRPAGRAARWVVPPGGGRARRGGRVPSQLRHGPRRTPRPLSLPGVTRTLCVVGTSYVGLSLAVLLAEHHDVVAFDIDEGRIDMLRQRRSPISDPDI